MATRASHRFPGPPGRPDPRTGPNSHASEANQRHTPPFWVSAGGFGGALVAGCTSDWVVVRVPLQQRRWPLSSHESDGSNARPGDAWGARGRPEPLPRFIGPPLG
jgi:hypothetical protein